jgi:hypothetical protein
MQHVLFIVLNPHSVLFVVCSTSYTHYNIQIQRITVQIYTGSTVLIEKPTGTQLCLPSTSAQDGYLQRMRTPKAA